MSGFMTAPRKGHLDALFHIFTYLNSHERSKLVFDDSYLKVNREMTPDWTSAYPNAREEIPPNAPKPRGKAVQITAFCDSDHAGDLLTRHSRSGILIFLNRVPILWLSKKQNSIESSTFGSEFTALKVCTEMIEGL